MRSCAGTPRRGSTPARARPRRRREVEQCGRYSVERHRPARRRSRAGAARPPRSSVFPYTHTGPRRLLAEVVGKSSLRPFAPIAQEIVFGSAGKPANSSRSAGIPTSATSATAPRRSARATTTRRDAVLASPAARAPRPPWSAYQTFTRRRAEPPRSRSRRARAHAARSRPPRSTPTSHQHALDAGRAASPSRPPRQRGMTSSGQLVSPERCARCSTRTQPSGARARARGARAPDSTS